ncbi:hypothetical protein HELRODRAFT_174352 [Helobdella robusta]|uniref:Uncharacterized protein n=1 Tax=Helobdella robusta TaxID=6412 RepID=T1F814_HELRO|nr:hypothetical protein HELRODRAFT_174352 [Helobdella robusta]ESO02900.1 hypothetical protein HELRODRAFT_174352 [Helobdella robusta]
MTWNELTLDEIAWDEMTKSFYHFQCSMLSTIGCTFIFRINKLKNNDENTIRNIEKLNQKLIKSENAWIFLTTVAMNRECSRLDNAYVCDLGKPTGLYESFCDHFTNEYYENIQQKTISFTLFPNEMVTNHKFGDTLTLVDRNHLQTERLDYEMHKDNLCFNGSDLFSDTEALISKELQKWNNISSKNIKTDVSYATVDLLLRLNSIEILFNNNDKKASDYPTLTFLFSIASLITNNSKIDEKLFDEYRSVCSIKKTSKFIYDKKNTREKNKIAGKNIELEKKLIHGLKSDNLLQRDINTNVPKFHKSKDDKKKTETKKFRLKAINETIPRTKQKEEIIFHGSNSSNPDILIETATTNLQATINSNELIESCYKEDLDVHSRMNIGFKVLYEKNADSEMNNSVYVQSTILKVDTKYMEHTVVEDSPVFSKIPSNDKTPLESSRTNVVVEKRIENSKADIDTNEFVESCYTEGLDVLSRMDMGFKGIHENNVDVLLRFVEGDKKKVSETFSKEFALAHKEESKPKTKELKKKTSQVANEDVLKIPPYSISYMSMHNVLLHPEHENKEIEIIEDDRDFTVVERKRHAKSKLQDEDESPTSSKNSESLLESRKPTDDLSVEESKVEIKNSVYEESTILKVDTKYLEHTVVEDFPVISKMFSNDKTPLESSRTNVVVEKRIENSKADIDPNEFVESCYTEGLDVLSRMDMGFKGIHENNVDVLLRFVEGDKKKVSETFSKEFTLAKPKTKELKKKTSQVANEDVLKIPPYSISHMSMHNVLLHPEHENKEIEIIEDDRDFTVVERKRHAKSKLQDEDESPTSIKNSESLLASRKPTDDLSVEESKVEIKNSVYEESTTLKVDTKYLEHTVVKDSPIISKMFSNDKTPLESSRTNVVVEKRIENSKADIDPNEFVESCYTVGLDVLRRMDMGFKGIHENNVDVLLRFVEGDKKKKKTSQVANEDVLKIPPYSISHMSMHNVLLHPEHENKEIEIIEDDRDFTVVERKRHAKSKLQDEDESPTSIKNSESLLESRKPTDDLSVEESKVEIKNSVYEESTILKVDTKYLEHTVVEDSPVISKMFSNDKTPLESSRTNVVVEKRIENSKADIDPNEFVESCYTEGLDVLSRMDMGFKGIHEDNVDVLLRFVEGDKKKVSETFSKEFAQAHKEESKPKTKELKKKTSQVANEDVLKIPPYSISHMSMHNVLLHPEHENKEIEIIEDVRDFTVVERKRHTISKLQVEDESHTSCFFSGDLSFPVQNHDFVPPDVLPPSDPFFCSSSFFPFPCDLVETHNFVPCLLKSKSTFVLSATEYADVLSFFKDCPSILCNKLVEGKHSFELPKSCSEFDMNIVPGSLANFVFSLDPFGSYKFSSANMITSVFGDEISSSCLFFNDYNNLYMIDRLSESLSKIRPILNVTNDEYFKLFYVSPSEESFHFNVHHFSKSCCIKNNLVRSYKEKQNEIQNLFFSSACNNDVQHNLGEPSVVVIESEKFNLKNKSEMNMAQENETKRSFDEFNHSEKYGNSDDKSNDSSFKGKQITSSINQCSPSKELDYQSDHMNSAKLDQFKCSGFTCIRNLTCSLSGLSVDEPKLFIDDSYQNLEKKNVSISRTLIHDKNLHSVIHKKQDFDKSFYNTINDINVGNDENIKLTKKRRKKKKKTNNNSCVGPSSQVIETITSNFTQASLTSSSVLAKASTKKLKENKVRKAMRKLAKEEPETKNEKLMLVSDSR